MSQTYSYRRNQSLRLTSHPESTNGGSAFASIAISDFSAILSCFDFLNISSLRVIDAGSTLGAIFGKSVVNVLSAVFEKPNVFLRSSFSEFFAASALLAGSDRPAGSAFESDLPLGPGGMLCAGGGLDRDLLYSSFCIAINVCKWCAFSDKMGNRFVVLKLWILGRNQHCCLKEEDICGNLASPASLGFESYDGCAVCAGP
jgi:hypothetical protein